MGQLLWCLRNSHQVQRFQSLEMKRQRLKFSKAPMSQKQAALPIHFWAMALHGGAFLPLWATALCWTFLRLNVYSDGGPWSLSACQHCLDLQRMFLKMQSFAEDWCAWMALFRGVLGQGPFSKLSEQLTLVHWLSGRRLCLTLMVCSCICPFGSS